MSLLCLYYVFIVSLLCLYYVFIVSLLCLYCIFIVYVLCIYCVFIVAELCVCFIFVFIFWVSIFSEYFFIVLFLNYVFFDYSLHHMLQPTPTYPFRPHYSPWLHLPPPHPHPPIISASLDGTRCMKGMSRMIRLISVLGTVAHYQMVHVDVTVRMELKRRSRVKVCNNISWRGSRGSRFVTILVEGEVEGQGL